VHARGLVSGNYGVGNVPDVTFGMVVKNYVALLASLMSIRFLLLVARREAACLHRLWRFVSFTAVEWGDLQPVCESLCRACVEFSRRFSL
jgi:hypothetical protein